MFFELSYVCVVNQFAALLYLSILTPEGEGVGVFEGDPENIQSNWIKKSQPHHSGNW